MFNDGGPVLPIPFIPETGRTTSHSLADKSRLFHSPKSAASAPDDLSFPLLLPLLLFLLEGTEGNGRLSDRDVADPRIDPNGSAGWVVLNAALEIRRKGGFRFGIRGANFFDKRYREHGSGIDAIGRSLGLWFSFEMN